MGSPIALNARSLDAASVDDLLHICDYTAEHFGAAQARRVADAIYETAASLQEMPTHGRIGGKPDTREMLIGAPSAGGGLLG